MLSQEQGIVSSALEMVARGGGNMDAPIPEDVVFILNEDYTMHGKLTCWLLISGMFF